MNKKKRKIKRMLTKAQHKGKDEFDAWPRYSDLACVTDGIDRQLNKLQLEINNLSKEIATLKREVRNTNE